MTLETWMSKLSPHGLPHLELNQQRRESRSMESPRSPRVTGRLFDANLFRPRQASGSSPRSGSVEAKTSFPSMGTLAVEIVGADDLAAADFNGKSDPFVVLELDGQSFRSVTVPHTLSPRWKDQRAEMAIADISSILFCTVYDQDRFGDPELLGRIAVPVVGLENNVTTTKVLPLRTKNFAKLTKGTVQLKLLKTWDFHQVALSTITPFERPPEAKDFKGCFEWTHPSRSVKAFVAFLVVTYNFEFYMTPLFCVAFIFMRPAFRELNQRTALVSAVAVDDFSSFDSTEENEGITLHGPDDPDADEDKSVAYKIRTGSIFVQNGLGLLASSVESVWTLIDFRVPCMSWLLVACLLLCGLVLYLVPLRWIVLLWGVNKFTKKLRNRHHVSSSEVFNFLNRVPDRPSLEKFFDPLGQNEATQFLSPDRESKKVGQKKNSFFYNKKISKKSG